MPRHARFEYMIARPKPTDCQGVLGNSWDVTAWLNDLGSRGWVLCCVSDFQYYFRRRLHPRAFLASGEFNFEGVEETVT